MKHLKIGFFILAILAFLAAYASGRGQDEESVASSPAASPTGDTANMSPAGSETAVLAGGCFWGMEGVFERLNGVLDVVSGYSGGEADTAHYYTVAKGTTGHAESIRIYFDPDVISYQTILKVFFLVAHDPTELNFQGPDHGTQYRSAIFYADNAQKKIAESYIKELDASGVFSDPIVTQVVPLTAFYMAEPDHQDFMARNPNYPYIVYWDRPKVEKLVKEYPELVAAK